MKTNLVLFSLIFAALILNDSFVSPNQTFLEKRTYVSKKGSNEPQMVASESYSSITNPVIYKDRMIHMTLTNNESLRYTSTLLVGSNNQKLNVQFDTGSYFFVMPDKSLSNQFYNTFNCDKSSTCEEFSHMKINITYGNSKLHGHFIQDKFTLGGDFSMTPDAAILATHWKTPGKSSIDAVFGLGYQRNPEKFIRSKGLEPTGCTSFNFAQSLKNKGLIDKSQFAFFLESNASNDVTAEFMIGGYDPKYTKGEMVFLDVVSDNEWAVRLNSITIGNQKSSITSGNGRALIDSGTGVLTFPKVIYEAVISYIQENSECKQIKDLLCVNNKTGLPMYVDPFSFPVIEIELDGMTAYFRGEAYTRIFNGNTMVEIMNLNMNHDVVILGDTFFRQYLTLFDHDQGRIGIAPSINYHEPTSTMKNANPVEPDSNVNAANI